MENIASALATAIGGRVRNLRQERRWTLDQLADAAGVSRRMVVNVEQGVTNPSVGTLLRLGEALGVTLSALVAPVHPKPVRVTRRGDGAVLWRSEAGGRGILAAATESPDVVELWDWLLAPGDRHDSEAHPPRTAELVQVQHGSLTIEAGEESVTLGAGDAATFSGDVPHSYANPGDLPARFTLAVFEPGPGRRTRREPADG